MVVPLKYLQHPRLVDNNMYMVEIAFPYLANCPFHARNCLIVHIVCMSQPLSPFCYDLSRCPCFNASQKYLVLLVNRVKCITCYQTDSIVGVGLEAHNKTTSKHGLVVETLR
jgi:hypothetical protein